MSELNNRSSSVCILVSGGVESSVLLADALGRYTFVTPIYIRNYLRWEEAEIFSLKNFYRSLKSDRIRPLKIMDLTMKDLYEHHWSVTGVKVPNGRTRSESVYLPGRNIIFLAKAACYAAIHDISILEIGVLKGNPFSDSTKLFFKKMSDVLSMGLGKDITVRAPFQNLSKEKVIQMGKHLPLEFTFSCINPKGYEHCGECNKCVERKKAFFSSGVFDKTRYKKSGI